MKKILVSLLSISAVFFLISCGSKPAPDETPKKAPVEAPVIEENEETEESVSEEPVSDEVDLEALCAQIDEARDAAIEAGADEKAPELLKQIDDLYESLKDGNLKDNADMLMARYKLLANYLKAKDAKDEIDENGFAIYAQNDYDEGAASLGKVTAVLESADEISESALSDAEKAYGSFSVVLNVAYKRLAKQEREEAYAAKKLADSVKAGVSQKERYKAAVEDFQNGDSLYSMQSPKKAFEKYTSAKDEFNALYNEVSEKRAAAQAAIEAAKQRVAESAKYAEDADLRSPITEEVDGIEDEDAVLLEEDEYEDPAEAEAEIAESIDDTEEADETLDEETDDEESDEYSEEDTETTVGEEE